MNVGRKQQSSLITQLLAYSPILPRRCHKLAQAPWALLTAGVVLHQPHPRVGLTSACRPSGLVNVTLPLLFRAHRGEEYLADCLGGSRKKEEPVANKGVLQAYGGPFNFPNTKMHLEQKQRNLQGVIAKCFHLRNGIHRLIA